MNIYDFDGTIYQGDSTRDFYFYVLKSYPQIMRFAFKQILGFIMYSFNLCSKTVAKEYFFSFLKGVPNVNQCINAFWARNEANIMAWYKENKKYDDVIITASPDFLIRPICKKLGVKYLIASNVSIENGEFYGENCYGIEKVERLHAIFPEASVEKFYSDSLSDLPLKELAKEAFIIKAGKEIPWEDYILPTKSVFCSIQFIRFLLIGLINAVNGVLFAYCYSLLIQTNVGFICGYLTSLAISYFLNSYITFQEPLSWLRFTKFCVSYLPNFLIQNLIVIIFMNYFKWPALPVYILAVTMGVPITFLCVKYLAFSKK